MHECQKREGRRAHTRLYRGEEGARYNCQKGDMTRDVGKRVRHKRWVRSGERDRHGAVIGSESGGEREERCEASP
jgi:hypothetical protein